MTADGVELFLYQLFHSFLFFHASALRFPLAPLTPDPFRLAVRGARLLTARTPPLKTSPFLLSPALHLSCCPIWCCLSSCHYLCPMCLYQLAAVTSICEAALIKCKLSRPGPPATIVTIDEESPNEMRVYVKGSAECCLGRSYVSIEGMSDASP
ncbi:unnamed protein product [Pleuronectes platessa]|uniref:Uncharacterized protein n=1 Tax=Pleuronectes platessa TaxID=8262 RepID=A0A9N7Z6A4_PLEPL|nr:unnamed protein product [Pleuronectes platessa]